jgi:fructoselysine-6-P-deglycase FrlB-like protein
VDPALFLRDLERKPEALGRLAAGIEADDPWSAVSPHARRVVFLGMGSSRFAADVAALRLRAAGIDAVAEYASARSSYPADPETLVVAISATGGSRETLDAVGRYVGRSPVIALTNRAGSPVTDGADAVVLMEAGDEEGGVACRTFQHTGLLLRGLHNTLTGTSEDLPALCRRVAEASADLLDRRGEWLKDISDLLDGPQGVYTLASPERWSSAAQSALMVREGPRRPAAACETGDWAHIDVYLTKTLDYRAVLFPGSVYDAQAMQWCMERESTVVSVGAEVAGTAATVRYLGDDDPDVALYTETGVAELVAATWWGCQS